MSQNPILKLNPFKVPESNVFFMTRFRNELHHQELSDAVSAAVRAFGLEFLRADNPNLAETLLWQRVQYCMEACHSGVAVFEAIDEDNFNPNVSLELGYMMGLGNRHLLLLKERRLKKLPADLLGHLYKEFDSFSIEPTVLGRIAEWLKSTGDRKTDGQKLIVFVSYGGTDRCAIAKVITDNLLDKDKFTLSRRIESRAAFNTSGSKAAKTGIEVVQKRLRADLLGKHRPRRAGSAFLFEADLILATDSQVLSKLLESHKNYPGSDHDRLAVSEEIAKKLYLVSEFFGAHGDIEDPYPDKEDAASRLRYEKCFDDLHQLISTGLSRLTEFLERDDLPKTKVRTVSFGDRTLFGTTEA